MKIKDLKTGIVYLFIAEHPYHPVVILETPENTYITVTFDEFDMMEGVGE